MAEGGESSDLTVQILASIRDEIVGLRADTNERLDKTNERLEGVEVRMERVERGLTDLGGFMKQIALDMAKFEHFHAHHVEVLERDLDDVKARLRALEAKS